MTRPLPGAIGSNMSNINAAATIEDDDPIDALEEFAPKIREILREYRAKRQLSAIARQLGFHESRLTEMITTNDNGEYKKRITPHYLAKFLDGGIMTVSQLLDGRKLDELADRPRLFFERMLLSGDTLRLVIETQRRGIDLDKVLQEILYPDPKS